MIILMAAAALLGVFLGRFFKASSLFPTSFLIVVFTLAGTPLPMLDSALRAVALIVILQLAYAIGLASTDIPTICRFWREVPGSNSRRRMCLLYRLRTRPPAVVSKDTSSGRDDTNETSVGASPAPILHADKRSLN
ncbi:hypothetical protein [Methylocella tundrae]|nr:hypothetical protein SIN04_12490 [Methylocella tundrae]